jgi:toxin-antitoxin system PIN domain toxin
MIVPDANLLLYAVNRDSPEHAKAWEWWTGLIETRQPVALCSGVLFAFVRLSTNRRVFAKPLTVAGAFAYANNWLSFETVRLAESTSDDIAVVESLLQGAGTGGNLVSDAQIAAVAIRLGGIVHSADHDFARFEGLKWHDPLR